MRSGVPAGDGTPGISRNFCPGEILSGMSNHIKSEDFMKKLLVSVMLVMLVLSGCSLFELRNSIVGTWETTLLGVTTRYVFNNDGTSVGTVTVLGIGASTNGVWNADNTTLTISWAGAEEDEVDYYSFNNDKSAMTLAPSEGGLSRTFDRL